MADNQPVTLKVLLKHRHLQGYTSFCREYDKVARKTEPELAGKWPSRAQFYRWLSGELQGLPYPDHCRILEGMFPGWTVDKLFEPHHDGIEYVPEPTAAVPARSASTPSENGHEVGKKLVAVQKVFRLSDEETHALAKLSGNIVELDYRITFDIDKDGWAHVTYRHELLNLGERPLTKISRELWFERTSGKLDIKPVNEGKHRVAVRRVHDTPNMANFACQFSPPVQPGEYVTAGYTCEGGQFVDKHYWRQEFPRHTRRLTVVMRMREAGQLLSCTAIEEHEEGAENSATEDLVWDYEGNDVLLTLTRDNIWPNQAVTLRWELANEPA